MSNNSSPSDGESSSSEDTNDDGDKLVIKGGPFKLRLEDPTPLEIILLGIIAAMIFVAVIVAGNIAVPIIVPGVPF